MGNSVCPKLSVRRELGFTHLLLRGLKPVIKSVRFLLAIFLIFLQTFSFTGLVLAQEIASDSAKLVLEIPKLAFPFTGNYSVTQSFGEEEKDPRLPKLHNGIDFALEEGTAVLAVDNGVVLYAQEGDYGITVKVKHDWGESIYGHLKEVKVAIGQTITKGNILALSGDSGISTGPHLHLSIKDALGEFVDPLLFLESRIESLESSEATTSASLSSDVLGEATESASQSNPQAEDISKDSGYLFNYKFNLEKDTTIHFYDKLQKRAGFTVADREYDSKLRFFLKESTNSSKPKIGDNIVEFPVIISGIDMKLRYTLSEDKVKEEFIIEQKPSPQTLSELQDKLNIPFDIQLVNLKIEQNDSEYIIYNQNNQFLWKLLTPTLGDSAGNQGKISLEVAQDTASLKVDSEFLKTAQYPVVIDPTWTQTNWSGGSGQTSWSDDTKYDSGSNVDVTTTSGQFTLSASNSWYNTGWGYRKKITIDASQVAGSSDFTNFPVLINTTDTAWKSTANSGHVASATGNDILFTASDGTTKLDHEIERYTATSGELVAWVEVPTLGATTNTDIYIYYGNSSAGSQQNATGVWDSNYKGVWHLGNGTTLSATDSTSNPETPTVNGNTTAASGVVDGGATFDGTNDNLKLGGGASGTKLDNLTQKTIEFWITPTTVTAGMQLIQKDDFNLWHIIFDANSKIRFRQQWSGPGVWAGGTTIVAGSTYHVAVTYDRSSTANAPVIYLNGSSDSASQISAPSGTVADDSAKDLYIAETVLGSGDYSGVMDEVRLSDTLRSADWIQTEYNNQNSPSTFYSIGSEASPVYNTSGSVTSSIFDSGQSSSWTTLSFTTSTPANTSASLKFRTSSSSTMSGATAFSSCTAVTSGSNAYSNSCVTNGHRYAQYEVSLSTTDTASTPTFSDFNVTYSTDVSAPSLSLTAISPDPTTDTTPTLSGTATDASTVSDVEFQVDATNGTWTDCTADDGSFDEATDTFTCTTSALSGGSHTIYVRATDSNGNTTSSGSESSDAFTIDATAPSISLTALDPDPNTDTTPTLTGTATEALGTVSNVQFQMDATSGSWTACTADDGSFDEGTEAFSCTAATALSEGSHTMYIRATDSASNTTANASAASDTFTVDTTAPSGVDLDSPGDNTFTSSARPVFKWKAATGISKYKLDINNGTGGDISIDNINPSRSTDLTTSKYVILYQNFTDTDSDNNYIALYTKSSSEWSSGENDGKLREGKRTWSVTAYDSAGNTKSGTRTIYADFTGPSLSNTNIDNLTEIDGEALVTATKPKVSGTMTDNLAYEKIELTFVRQNFLLGIPITTTTITQTKSFTNTTNATSLDFSFNTEKEVDFGIYTVTVTAIDKAGNRSSGNTFKIRILTEAAAKELIALKDKEKLEKLKTDSKISLESLEKQALLRREKEAAELEKLIAYFSSVFQGLNIQIPQILLNNLAALQEATLTARAKILSQAENFNDLLTQGLTVLEESSSAGLVTTLSGIAYVSSKVTDVIPGFGEISSRLLVSEEKVKDQISSLNETNLKGFKDAALVLVYMNNKLTDISMRFDQGSKGYVSANSEQIESEMIRLAASGQAVLTDLQTSLNLSQDKAKDRIGQTHEQASAAVKKAGEGVKLVYQYIKKPIDDTGDFFYRVNVGLNTFQAIVFDPTPTQISKVTIEELGEDYAVISWETNHFAWGKVNYGEDLSYGKEVILEKREKYHQARLTGLEKGKRYFFEVMSQNKNYAYDAYYSFELKE